MKLNETAPFDGARPAFGVIGKLYFQVFGTVQRYVTHDVIALFMRLTVAGVFWRSMLTKVETMGVLRYVEVINDFEVERFRLRLPELPLEIRPATHNLFANQYALPLIPPEWAAVMATLAEFALPILLVLGLLTRFAAAGLLAMTLVIQIFVFPNAWWGTHALWAAMLVYLVARGGGRLGADYAAARLLARLSAAPAAK